MTSFRRFLVDNWVWWLLPLLAVAGLVTWVLLAQPQEGMGNGTQFNYDLH